MKLALKIDVDTYHGTRKGVPRLVELLRKHGAGATFFFTGVALGEGLGEAEGALRFALGTTLVAAPVAFALASAGF